MLCHSKKMFSTLLSLITATTAVAYAQPIKNTPEINMIVAPSCLLNTVKTPYHILSTQSFSPQNTVSLIEIAKDHIEELAEAKHKHRATACGGFVDVTQAWQESQRSTKDKKTLTPSESAPLFLKNFIASSSSHKHLAKNAAKEYKIQYPTEVNQLLKQMNPQNLWADLATLTRFPDRYANSDHGVQAAAWIKSEIEKIAEKAGRKDVTTYYVNTGGYKQPSLVVKMGNSTQPGIVIGGHMDTLSSNSSLKPGADDDGSGTVTVLEIARQMISSNMQFKKPVYFIWYAAEEMGLVGSSYVVSDFKKKKIPVDAVLQLDMTGYAYKNEPTLWLITDNVDKNLTQFLETLISTYVKKPVSRSRCGYECSDHASWNRGGMSAAFPFEAKFDQDNPHVHTSQDKMEFLSLDHMKDYTNLGLAFAVELAEPISS